MDYSKINLQIIIRYLNGTCSMDEEIQLREWMQEDSENEEFLLFVKKIWDTSTEKKKFQDVDSAWLRFNNQFDLDDKQTGAGIKEAASGNYNRSQHKSVSMHWLSWSAVAAAVTLIVFMSIKFADIDLSSDVTEIAEEIEYREVKTDKGQRTRLRLSDGSTIHLNAGSRLLVPETFGSNERREVTLEGEAYFEVTHDPTRQFVVTTEWAVTKVLGTKFNVNTYSEGDRVLVAVADGAVSLESAGDDMVSGKTINKSQIGTVSQDGITHVAELTDLSQFIGWTNGELVFKQDSLAAVIQKLERWYGIDIELEIKPEENSGKRLTATFTDRQRLGEVLESISLVLDFEYKHHSYLANTFTFYNNQHER
ncbi:DUF4974 domain-containing protein [Rhodohalobacter sp. SW132]|uniref:FecR family protein n=1 Tax=Rhodohalobacter sp. SW132 TaxID=2293433 RepID=UPI000E25C0CE|nr:FecR domain-containing protein [Rhodohalobacter sp. SW132]REL39085.1 DUF4974 domain-containing protein [Rhodohalobacter sp. SW132]